MTNALEDDCLICYASQRAKGLFAVAKPAEHALEKARRDHNHRQWIDEHTTNGTFAEIRDALEQHGRPRQELVGRNKLSAYSRYKSRFEKHPGFGSSE
ncbi:hypothetical protein DMJ13_21635 [halophilic archaeon]|nr:hypothetical protein DMJ13_21635 [halophilic archaeon]